MIEKQEIHSVAVILPIFNECGLVEEAVNAVRTFAVRNPHYQFLFVDDGSDDGTAEILRDIITGRGENAIAYFHHARNQGKGAAIRTGFSMVEADALCFIDADLAYSLDHLKQMEESLTTNDVVIGSRKMTAETTRPSLRRHILGEIFNKLSRLILKLPFQDTQAGVKGFRLPAARRLFEKSSLNGFGFDVELLFLARKWGMPIAEIPARVNKRHSYKKGKLKLMKDSTTMLMNLLLIQWKDLTGKYD